MSEKSWIIADSCLDAAELAGRLKTSPLIAQILINRGITDAGDCRDFLLPTLKLLPDPSLIANLPRAAQRIAQAIRDRQKIVIYGDYDVDGITATSILWHAIRLLGGRADYYIPHRIEEGYGLNSDAITQICDDGANLIVSVDCGITGLDQAKIAASRNVDLIITDHHESCALPHADDLAANVTPPRMVPVLPECYAIVHPRLSESPLIPSTYPNPHLCGAGVAFKLAWGIGQAMSGATRVSDDFRAFLVEATALAALGTIADVVPLQGENRILAHFGLGGLKQSKLTGIKALIASAKLTGQKLNSYHVGFLLAPRLNASGRMGHAREAVEMLTSADEPRALEIAHFLETQNRERQGLEKAIFEQALEQCVQLHYDSEDCRAIVLGGESWHPGVIGIVASRIVNRFHRPTVMIALNNGHGQGSARSISGFHLAHALAACGEHLETFGGHEMAAGLSLQTHRLPDFREAFCSHATRTLRPEQLQAQLHLDCAAELKNLNEALVKELARLGPFGQSNPQPLLFLHSVEIAGRPRRVGRSSEHLQFQVKHNTTTMKCIAFRRGDMIDQLPPGTKVDLAAQPSINEFNGRCAVELEVKDIRLSR